MNIGLKTFKVSDSVNHVHFPYYVFYPSDHDEKEIEIGPYTISVAENGKILNKKAKLIIVSHGSGGTFLAYRDLIFYLVKNGFTVVCPVHFGNNRDDNSLAGDRKNLILRPHHIKLVLNDISKISEFTYNQVYFIGHSMGGYTGLVLAGGEPWLSKEEKLPTDFDPRIKSFILLSPAAGYFAAPGALDAVTSPLQVWVGEKDEFTPPWQAELVRDHIPKSTEIDFHLIKNGNHFCFLSPYPKSLQHLQPAKDLPGFDRKEFQKIFFPKVLSFLNSNS